MKQSTDNSGANTPITLCITRKIAPNSHDAFQAWMRKGVLLAAGFPGFLGAGVLAPSADDCRFQILLRFSDAASMTRWERSLSRRMWLERGETLIQESQSHRMSGIELIFGPSNEAVAPPRWKRAISIWTLVYPLALSTNVAIQLLLPPVPVFARVMMTTLVQVPFMIYLGAPLANRVFGRWLYSPK